jgi:CheY-like chemotaxis protein
MKPPTSPGATNPSGGPAAPGPAPILVVDDDPLVQELMARSLSREGFRVMSCTTGGDAVRMARSVHPAAITLDLDMPDMDGWSILAALKADPLVAAIPVIVVTITDERNKAHGLGVADYLLKPVDRARLVSVLRSLPATAPVDRSVLVIEDDSANREMLARLLRKAGYTVSAAVNGRTALERLSETPPRLILLDLMMPVMDGFTLVQELQHDLALRSIPIIVITAKDLTQAERQQLGSAVGKVFLKGTYTHQQLLNEVQRLLSAPL